MAAVGRLDRTRELQAFSWMNTARGGRKMATMIRPCMEGSSECGSRVGQTPKKGRGSSVQQPDVVPKHATAGQLQLQCCCQAG